MNPSHFPQVIRSRSRSPSPSRRRLCDCTEAEDRVKRPRTKSDAVRSADRQVENEGRDGGDSDSQRHAYRQFLTVPQDDLAVTRKQRSLSDSDRRTRRSRKRQRELQNMTTVEIVSAHHSVNSDDPQPPAPTTDRSDTDNSPTPDIVTLTDTDSCRDGEPTRPTVRERVQKRLAKEKPVKASWTVDQVEQLRRRLKFFFMDPCNKFRARRHIPWKMFLQFLKILIITVQLVQFGGQRSDVVEYLKHNQKTLQHLLLKDWDPSFETMPYPPATGVYALYSVDELLDAVQFAWGQYYNLSESSLATINLLRRDGNGSIIPMRMCNRLNNYFMYPNGSYIVGPGVVRNCTDLDPLEGKNPYNIREFLRERNMTIAFTKLLELTLEFAFNTFHLNLIETHYGPICYRVESVIRFENYERSGQVLITLSSTITQRVCTGKIMSPDAEEEENLMRRRSVGFDAFVICICILSIILCVRSLLRAWKLKGLTEKMFWERQGKRLELNDRMEFVNLWYFLIIVNDIFTIIGASFKIQLETRSVSITSYNYDVCSLMLGLGGLLAWIGCLRYLSFFKKYNILIVTLKTAFPNVARFCVCALAMYGGFMFCGWVILGPYHIKFRHLSTTSECLFSLVNGDDMFVTFSAMETQNLLMWYFARIYLYAFISLFIYCVLSLFIAVIMDTYETIKSHTEDCPKTELWHFIEECNHPVHSGLYRRQHTENEANDWSLIEIISKCCCRKKKEDEEVGEVSPLLTQTI